MRTGPHCDMQQLVGVRVLALLQALATLATRHVGLLRGYSSYLANILDHLEGFSNTQLQQVFSMFAYLTARTPAATAAGGTGAASGTAGESHCARALVVSSWTAAVVHGACHTPPACQRGWSSL